MYNMLFGQNPISNVLLEILQLTEEGFGRFRDCYLSSDGSKIIVYTRNGGGNREKYQGVFDELSKHENYICDYDDDFDCTYASIEFSVPQKYKEICKELAKISDTSAGQDKFKKILEQLETKDE